VSHRFRYVEPFVRFWYMLPIAAKDSLFKDHGGGMDNVRPQQHAGNDFGLEIIPWNPDADRKIGIQLSGHVSAAFEGRGYSEMWEVFRRNPSLAGPCRPARWAYRADDPETDLDENPIGAPATTWDHCDEEVDPDVDNDLGSIEDDGLLHHPGVTDMENYAIFGGDVAFNVRLSQYARFTLGAGLANETAHFITFTDAGDDRRGTNPTSLDPRKDLPNGLVDPDDSEEVHPLHRPVIDQVGRRYRADETTIFTVFVSGALTF
jgi:hypothetical protein